MAGEKISAAIDITGDVCPMTWVKTKLELEEMATGDLLEVLIREGESLENVTRSAPSEGHEVVVREEKERPVWRLVIRRGDGG